MKPMLGDRKHKRGRGRKCVWELDGEKMYDAYDMGKEPDNQAERTKEEKSASIDAFSLPKSLWFSSGQGWKHFPSEGVSSVAFYR